MSSLFFGRKKSYNRFGVLLCQQRLVKESFPFLECTIIKDVLVCVGWVQPDGCKDRYKIKIEYVAGHEPRSTILYPKIEPCRDIHMYSNHSLCLHYPPDMWWNERINIHEYTIPWVLEWIVFYEIYLLNGNKWEGRQSPTHFNEADQNINRNID
ncbi:MAG: hypothetical protein QM594_12360 [Niabella sp.]